MSLTHKITGQEKVRRTLLRIGRDAARVALAATAEEVEALVEAGAAKHNRSGALVRSIYMRRDGEDWNIGHTPQTAPHAIFVHWGTKPHPIYPKGANMASFRELYGPNGSQRTLKASGKLKGMPGGRKLVLRWPVAGGAGGWRFAQHVNHPGNKADPWLVRAAAQAPAIFERHVAAQLARITGG